MKIFAIGDLHLSTAVDKPMNIFGDNWNDHHIKIFENWKERVSDEDIVLVAGDISWASKISEAKEDLEIIDRLPGKKYLIRGNHDYWWTTATSLNKIFSENMVFMNTKPEFEGDYAICGTRGWISPNDVQYSEKDFNIYKREANRLRISLEEAKKSGYEKYIVMMHYPPTNENFDDSMIMDIVKEYNPDYFIYGHLHGEESFGYGLQGKVGNTEFCLVSCDYLDFKLKEIKEID